MISCKATTSIKTAQYRNTRTGHVSHGPQSAIVDGNEKNGIDEKKIKILIFEDVSRKRPKITGKLPGRQDTRSLFKINFFIKNRNLLKYLLIMISLILARKFFYFIV